MNKSIEFAEKLTFRQLLPLEELIQYRVHLLRTLVHASKTDPKDYDSDFLIQVEMYRSQVRASQAIIAAVSWGTTQSGEIFETIMQEAETIVAAVQTLNHVMIERTIDMIARTTDAMSSITKEGIKERVLQQLLKHGVPIVKLH